MKRNIGIIAATIFFLLFIIYGGFETIKVILGPSLVIKTPTNLVTVHDPLVKVTGVVKRAAYITINDRQIFADLKGNFETELLVPIGYTIISVKVRDRFGKEVMQNISLSYVPEENK